MRTPHDLISDSRTIAEAALRLAEWAEVSRVRLPTPQAIRAEIVLVFARAESSAPVAALLFAAESGVVPRVHFVLASWIACKSW